MSSDNQILHTLVRFPSGTYPFAGVTKPLTILFSKIKRYIDIVHKTITEVLNLHLKEKEKQIDNVLNRSLTVTDSTINPTTINNTNTNDKNNEGFIINDQLLVETLLMMIRGETIKYSSYRKKK